MTEIDELRAAALATSEASRAAANEANAAATKAQAAAIAASKATDAAAIEAAKAFEAATVLDTALEDLEPDVPILPPPDPSKCTWRSGMDANRDGDPFNEFEQFGEWRGLRVKGGLTFHGRGYFGPGKQWAGMHNSATIRKGGEIDRVLSHPGGYYVTHAQPLLLEAQAQKFSLLADGSLDEDHRRIAQTITATVDGRWDRFFLCLGWEGNKGYPWSLDGASAAELAQFVEGWHRAGLIYKEVSGGRMQIVWNHLKASQTRIGKYYPGDDVIDIIGVDPYDNGQSLGSGFIDDDKAWEKFLGAYDPATGSVQGIAGFRDFAIAHGKKISYCEWGATCQNENYMPDGSNNSYYVPKMVEWFKVFGDLLVYENYFNGPQKHKVYPKTNCQPLVSDAYKAAYSELRY